MKASEILREPPLDYCPTIFFAWITAPKPFMAYDRVLCQKFTAGGFNSKDPDVWVVVKTIVVEND